MDDDSIIYIGTVKTFPCSRCDVTFESRGKRNAHVNSHHRESVTMTSPEGVTKTIVRDTDGLISCLCGRSYKYPHSFVRHVKGGCHRLYESSSEVKPISAKESTIGEQAILSAKVL